MPESFVHKRMCELLYQVLAHALTPANAVVSDCFVYFDASDEQRCLAPDAFVKLGCVQDTNTWDAWFVWDKGAPELAIEILSPSNTKEVLSWPTKLERYKALGVRELVCFNSDEERGQRVRAWDRIDGDLVERIVRNDRTPCVTLSAHFERHVEFLLAGGDDVLLGLRLINGDVLLPTPLEAERAAKEAALRQTAALRAEIERLKKT